MKKENNEKDLKIHVISREEIKEMEEKIKFIKEIKNFRNIGVLLKGLKKNPENTCK